MGSAFCGLGLPQEFFVSRFLFALGALVGCPLALIFVAEELGVSDRRRGQAASVFHADASKGLGPAAEAQLDEVAADHLGARWGAAQRGLTSGEILRQLLPSVILVFEDEGDVLL